MCIHMYNGKPPFGIAIPCIAEDPRIAKRILYSMLYLTNKTFITLHYETKKEESDNRFSCGERLLLLIFIINVNLFAYVRVEFVSMLLRMDIANKGLFLLFILPAMEF